MFFPIRVVVQCRLKLNPVEYRCAIEREDKPGGTAGTGALIGKGKKREKKKDFELHNAARVSANRRKIDFVFNFVRRGNQFEFNSVFCIRQRFACRCFRR